MTQSLNGLESRYSKALYELAKDAKSVDSIHDELVALKALLDGDLGHTFKNPSLRNDDKRDLVLKIAKEVKLSKLLTNFLGLVAEKGRLEHLEGMIDSYTALRAQDNNERTAQVFTAQPLTAAQKKKVEAFVKSLDKTIKTVNLEEVPDADLIAGMKVRVDSVEYDASLKGSLNQLRAVMKG